MKNEKLGLLVNKNPWSWGVDFAYVRQIGNVVQYAEPLTIKTAPEGGAIAPCFELDEMSVQQLFDDLWRIGYRPKCGEGSEGHLGATNRHLEDMRKLVFEHTVQKKD
jgi:hypothetical protein